MAISTITQPPFIVDLESDRSTSWPDGCFVFCRDTHKMYELLSGSFYQMSPSTQLPSDWAQTNTSAADYIKNKPSLSTVATTGSYSDLSGKPSIPAAQIQSDWIQSTTSALDYIKNKPSMTRSFASVIPSIVTGTGATGTLISLTKDAFVSYTPTTVDTATILAGAVGTVVLEICSTNSTASAAWQEISRVTNGQVITLAVTLQSVQTIAAPIVGIVPAGYYRKVRSIQASGSPTFSISSGQEVLLY